MSRKSETFFTSVGCMDGRVQKPVLDFGQQKFGAEFVDTITEAGLVGQLSGESVDPQLAESLKTKIGISIEKHHSRGIIVHGHQECAGNPVADNVQRNDIRKSLEVVGMLAGKSIPIVGVFVKREGDLWVAEQVAE